MGLKFVCPTCREEIPRDLLVIVPHTENHIVEVIKKQHPDWVESSGICKKCYEHYKQQLHPKQ